MLVLNNFYDSDSDDDEDHQRRQEEEEDNLSQCPTTEYLPSLLSSAPRKEEMAESSGVKTALAPPAVDEHNATVPTEPAGADSFTIKRQSRRARGRSGRRHRRDTGVSGRALLLVEAAQLGPWPAAAFSKLCNLLKEAPAARVEVSLALRRAWSRPSLQLLVQHPSLRGGGMTFEQNELFSGHSDRAAALLCELARDPPDFERAGGGAPEGSMRSWPWSVVATI